MLLEGNKRMSKHRMFTSYKHVPDGAFHECSQQSLQASDTKKRQPNSY